nr:NADH dehydrogenase [ubiquinone] 1 alpha subcomplex subunit 7-like [Megalopta genalis]
MPGGVEKRTVTPAISIFRNFLRGKPVVESLRFADAVAARTQPPPTIPGGPYHKTSKVYYYTRDARRLVQPPIDITIQKQIKSTQESDAESKRFIPGKCQPIH